LPLRVRVVTCFRRVVEEAAGTERPAERMCSAPPRPRRCCPSRGGGRKPEKTTAASSGGDSGGDLEMGSAGLEPATYCLGGSRSIHLSYEPSPARLYPEQSITFAADLLARGRARAARWCGPPRGRAWRQTVPPPEPERRNRRRPAWLR